MDNQFIEIEQFAKLAGLSVSTIRRKIKSLSESNKKAFIRRVPVVGSGGEKILIDKAWLGMMNTHDKASNDELNRHDEPLTEKKAANQEQIKTPEYDNAIIEILRGQIERLEKQTNIKDVQISDLSHTNKELLERLKEVNYTLANAQKQLAAPVDEKEIDTPKWWQFWK